MIGEITLCKNKDDHNRYLRFFPEKSKYYEELNFEFYTLNIMGIRYIGGFGKAYWVSYKDIQDFEIVEESLEASTIEHMNADHQSSICKYINSEDESASIIAVDSLGFYVKGNMLYRVMFGNKNPVLTAEQMRKAFINLSDKDLSSGD